MRESRRLRAAAAIALLGLLLGCDGRTSWRRDPLPDYGDASPPAPPQADAPRVRMRTELGEVVMALYPERAPIAVRNFLSYVDEGFYDGTLLHRVTRVPMVVVQGGGLLPGFAARAARDPIRNEAASGLSNVRGTVAMARGEGADSATSQFYFNVTDNSSLDYRDDSRPGYTVFGVVVDGMDVVDRLSMTPTHRVPGNPTLREAPVDDLVIEWVRRET